MVLLVLLLLLLTYTAANNTAGAGKFIGISILGSSGSETVAISDAVNLATNNLAAAASFTVGASVETLTVAGAVTAKADAISLTANAITLGADLTANTSGAISFTGATTLTSAVVIAAAGTISFSSTLNGTSAGAQNLTLTAGISGDITLTGAVGVTNRLGAVTITSAATVLTSGTFKANSFTQSAGSVETTFTGLLDLTGAFGFTGTALNINGAGPNAVGTTMTVTNSGLFTTANTADLTVTSGFTQNGAGLNSLGGNITTSSTGISFAKGVTLTNDTTLTGTTITTGSTLGGSGFSLKIAGAAAIDGAVTSVTTLEVTGKTTLGASATAITTTDNQTYAALVLGADTTLDAGSGNISLPALVSGSSSLTTITVGAGVTTIAGANTNTTTNVTTGVVLISNSSASITNFAVSGGTLNGTGSIGTLTGSGTGIIAPGITGTPGKITTTGFSLGSGNALAIDITNATPNAGITYDQIVVATGGSVTLGDAVLSLSTAFAGTAGAFFVIIDNQNASGGLTGTFNGLTEGSIITANGRLYQISYTGIASTGAMTGGNDVILLLK